MNDNLSTYEVSSIRAEKSKCVGLGKAKRKPVKKLKPKSVNIKAISDAKPGEFTLQQVLNESV